MKKDWVAEARKRVQEDFKNVGSALFTEQVKANERMRKNFHLSKTEVRKAEVQYDEWLRTRLSRLSILEVILESHPGLGWKKNGRPWDLPHNEFRHEVAEIAAAGGA